MSADETAVRGKTTIAPADASTEGPARGPEQETARRPTPAPPPGTTAGTTAPGSPAGHTALPVPATETAPADVPAPAMPVTEPLLRVRNLRVTFGRGRRRRVAAVRGVDLTLHPGECLAVVGESGSGKSATARALVGLAGADADVRADHLELGGRELTRLSERELRRVRGRGIGLIQQDALVSLDPLRRVGAEIAETLHNHRIGTRADRDARVIRLLTDVSVPEPEVRARQYPHQLSGGLRQRALIASAVAAEPAVLIADEPTTALDTTVQAQILDLLAELKSRGTAVLLISHDLAVVARLADHISVMYQGTVVESGPVSRLLAAPRHPYTRQLLAAVPGAHTKGTRLTAPTPQHPAPVATGCAYAPRCPLADSRCAEPPPAAHVGPGHTSHCVRPSEPLPVRASAPRTRTDRTGCADPGLLLEVTGVSKAFVGPDRVPRPAVRDVSLGLRAGETLGVLGESGSGKSTLAAMVLCLLRPDAGTVRLAGEPWSELRESERTVLRGRVQHVPQDPLSSFDPRWTVERAIAEALGPPSRRTLARHRARVHELLDLVGLDPAAVSDRRPRTLSGGQRQRVAIARALAPDPELLVCDEPVSALDVSVQAQILDLFADIQDRLGVALLFISHDLGVIHHISDRVLVMRDGRVVETGTADDVFAQPQDPYTQSLLAAVSGALPDTADSGSGRDGAEPRPNRSL